MIFRRGSRELNKQTVVDGNAVSPQQASHEGIMSLNDLLEPSYGDHVIGLCHLKE